MPASVTLENLYLTLSLSFSLTLSSLASLSPAGSFLNVREVAVDTSKVEFVDTMQESVFFQKIQLLCWLLLFNLILCRLLLTCVLYIKQFKSQAQTPKKIVYRDYGALQD